MGHAGSLYDFQYCGGIGISANSKFCHFNWAGWHAVVDVAGYRDEKNQNMKKNLKVLIKKYLPKSVKVLILNLREQILLTSVWLFSRSRFLASLYYCFFSRKFSREHQAVLKGKWLYAHNKGMQKNTNTLLRRNIHRIEKGLIMRPRKSIFALDYIRETVCAFNNAKNNKIHDLQELKWASDVLTLYFSVVPQHSLDPDIKRIFDAGIERCSSYDGCGGNNTGLNIPYLFSDKIESKISSEQLLNLCLQRRSVRWYEEKPVVRSLLEQAVEIAALAPSACNRQPYQFHIANDKEIAQKLMSVPLGTKGFSHNVPCAIVVTADLAHYGSERDRHLIYIDSALASMQLMLALETRGLSTCPINWPDIEEREQKMASLLGLTDSVRPIMLIAVGYACPKGEIPFSHKKSAEELIRYVND